MLHFWDALIALESIKEVSVLEVGLVASGKCFFIICSLLRNQTWHRCTVLLLSPAGGIAFSSLDKSMFFPQDSLLTSVGSIPDPPNSAPVVCHSAGGNPVWLDSDGMNVSEDTSLPVHQMIIQNTARLVVTDLSKFTNGVYQCLSNGGMAGLGLFINSPGTVHVIVSH